MPHIVRLDPATGVVDVTLTGQITGDELRAVTTAATTLQKASGALKFLVDINGWDVTASVVDIYNLADKQ